MTYPSDPVEPQEASAARNGLIIGGVALVLLLLVGGVYLVTRNKGVGPTLSSENTLPGTTAPPANGSTTPRPATTRSGTSGPPADGQSTTVSSASGPSSSGVPTTPASTAPTTRAPTTPPTTAATTTTTKPKPSITSYTVPGTVTSSACATQGFTEISLAWDTANATSVTISIDGPGPFKTGLPAKGTLDVPFSGCYQTVSHTYMITATAADGTTATQTKTATYTKP